MEDYNDIINSYLNGQKKQALKQIKKYGWYDFVSELEEDETIYESVKLSMLCSLIRIDKK